MKWTENEIKFLKENYSTYGGKYCQPYVGNRKIDAINATAARLGLKVINKKIHPTLQNVSISNFIHINKKETAYFLGFLWADGYIHHYVSNKINHYTISIEIKSSDAESIKDIFFNVGNWNIQKRKRGDYSEVTLFTTNNKDLYFFLKENRYDGKSLLEPTKILEKIPDDLKIYFWKGLFDGDGSVGLNGRGAFFEIASTYDYEYLEIKKLFTTFEVVKFNIYRKIDKKNHKSSVIKIYGKEILKTNPLFVDYGLERKNIKFKKIKEKYEK
jgi:intein-encoded DNA endonuclease-like protein